MSYQPGDWVLLKLRPRRQSSVKENPSVQGKLAKRFYGPFKVIERVGPVAYRLQLPENARSHPVIHCSMLKQLRGTPESEILVQLPDQFLQDQPLISPLSILDYRRSTPADPWQVLVQWKWLTPDDTSWEDWDTLQQDYHLEDKVILQGPPSDSIVMSKVQIADKGAEQTEQYEGEVRIASDTKRKVSRPKYLKDYV